MKKLAVLTLILAFLGLGANKASADTYIDYGFFERPTCGGLHVFRINNLLQADSLYCDGSIDYAVISAELIDACSNIQVINGSSERPTEVIVRPTYFNHSYGCWFDSGHWIATDEYGIYQAGGTYSWNPNVCEQLEVQTNEGVAAVNNCY